MTDLERAQELLRQIRWERWKALGVYIPILGMSGGMCPLCAYWAATTPTPFAPVFFVVMSALNGHAFARSLVTFRQLLRRMYEIQAGLELSVEYLTKWMGR